MTGLEANFKVYCGDCGKQIEDGEPTSYHWVGNRRVDRCRPCTRAMLAKCEVQTFTDGSHLAAL